MDKPDTTGIEAAIEAVQDDVTREQAFCGTFALYKAAATKLRQAQADHTVAVEALAAFCPVKVGDRFDYTVDWTHIGGLKQKRAMRVRAITWSDAPWRKPHRYAWSLRGTVIRVADGSEGTLFVTHDVPVQVGGVQP